MRVETGVAVTLLLMTLSSCDAAYREKSWSGERQRRENKRGFTGREKEELVRLHNTFRSREPANNMLRMEWDEDVAGVAQVWADRCVWSHSGGGNGRLNKFAYIGENLFAATTSPTMRKIVEDWYNETVSYTFDTGGCTNVCGHYTQVVWHSSYALGCGIRYCSDIQFLDWRRHGGGYVVVCNYGPGGNYVGKRPYTKGPPCSRCPEAFKFCSKGLCSRSKSDQRVSDESTGQSVTACGAITLACFIINISLKLSDN